MLPPDRKVLQATREASGSTTTKIANFMNRHSDLGIRRTRSALKNLERLGFATSEKWSANLWWSITDMGVAYLDSKKEK